ncbi:MAG: ABC transporter ATP-binding protein [Oscillospiraceae bacterium]|nr:ABC transporter ATP-binding protein [Oscillospiraceae bacterium]
MIRKLAPYTKGYRVYILLGILCSAGEAVLELMLPKAMSNIVDYGIGGNGGAGDRTYILTMGLKMVLMALICLALGVGAAALAAKAGMGFGANVREAEYRQVQRFSFSNIEHFSTASLITRLTNDVSSVQMTLMMGMRMLVRAPVMLITALVMALRISLQLSQIFLVILPLLALMVFIVLRYVGPFFTSLQKATDGLNLVVQEDLNAIRVVKSFVREDREKEKFFQRSETLRQTAERAFGFVVTFIPMVNLIMGGTIVSIMWLGGHYVAGGQMLSGDLLAFFTYASEILMALMMVAMVMMVLTRSIACGKRIVEVLEEQPEITDDDAVKEIADDGTERELTLSDGSIRFDHVYFKYHPDSAEWNLTDIDFSIASGMTVGILGGTGSAKSTLVSLIPRLYEATEGAVYVGGHNVKDYTMETLREGCAMVLQKNTLFSGTIRDNLRWGDENATDQEMEAACRMACADEFISRMPDGYDTRIEQGGTNVSGGQKQRLCIARAILRKPKVLILDDSTSAVDTATDAKIRAALKEALPGSTKLIIAQRISSVMDADVILVLDDGKISGMGTHEQLMASNQIYREVYQSQQEGVSIDG